MRKASMKRSALTFLGRDSGFGKLNTSAYAIINNRLLLVDCGYTVMPKLLKSNIPMAVSGIDVIITHLHADHAGSLSQLVLYSYYVFKKPINIISNCKELDNFLTITGASRFLQTPGFPKERYTRNNDFVTLIQTDHVGEELDCYGFSSRINGTSVVYTGDTKTLEPFMPFIAPKCQLFTDASCSGGVHLNLEENLPLLKELSSMGVQVFLMHLDDESRIRKMIEGTKIQIAGD